MDPPEPPSCASRILPEGSFQLDPPGAKGSGFPLDPLKLPEQSSSASGGEGEWIPPPPPRIGSVSLRRPRGKPPGPPRRATLGRCAP